MDGDAENINKTVARKIIKTYEQIAMKTMH